MRIWYLQKYRLRCRLLFLSTSKLKLVKTSSFRLNLCLRRFKFARRRISNEILERELNLPHLIFNVEIESVN